MKELTANIDLDHEVAAVASFISLKWTAIGNVQQMVAEIRRIAERYGRSLFDHHPLWCRAKELHDARRALLEQQSGLDARVGLEYYDAVCILLYGVKWSAEDISKAGRAMLGAWDLGTRSKKLHTALEERYPDLTHARPRGWAELENGAEDFATRQEAYDPQPDRDAFHGACVQGTLSAELPVRLALPEVFLHEKCQGRKASVQLVAAVLAHFMGITEFLNTVRAVEALPRAVQQLDEPFVVFERAASTDNPFLKVAFETANPCRTPADLAQAIGNLAEYDALSDEGKARRAAERDKSVAEFISGLKDSADEDQKKRAAEMERYSVLLSAALEG